MSVATVDPLYGGRREGPQSRYGKCDRDDAHDDEVRGSLEAVQLSPESKGDVMSRKHKGAYELEARFGFEG